MFVGEIDGLPVLLAELVDEGDCVTDEVLAGVPVDDIEVVASELGVVELVKDNVPEIETGAVCD